MFRVGFRVLKQQYVGVLALLLALGGTASAATGDFLKLGLLNEADKATIVRNTGNGPALRLRVAANQAPFTVNSGKLVRRLNAAKLRGMGPKAFAPAQGSPNYVAAGTVYSKEESDARYAELGSSYTKAESNGRYLSVFGPRLLYSTWESGITAGKVINNRQFTAPAAGTLIATINGQCVNVGTTGGKVTLSASVGVENNQSETGPGVLGTVAVGCGIAQGLHLDAGEEAAVTIEWSKVNNGGTLLGPSLEAAALVTFQPDPILILP